MKKNIWFGILGIFAISLVFFYQVIFSNKVPLPVDALVGAHLPWVELKWEGYPAGVPVKNLEITDAISQFYPWRSLVGEYWRKGELPLWNRFMFAGAPFLASWHSASLYPINFIYLFLSNIEAWTLLIYLQILLAGVFMYIFLDSFKIAKIGSFFGGIIFAFSGYMISWLEFGTGGQAGLWLPLLLLFEYKLIKENRDIYIALIGIVYLFIFTAGDFQIPLYCFLAYVVFGSFIIFKEIINTSKIRSFLKLIFGLLLGLTISSIQLLPAIELFRNSIRVSDSYIKEYHYGLMDFSKVLNFIWPDFFGNIVTGNYWGRFGYHEYLAFTGIVSLIFLAYSYLHKKTSVEKSFWILLAISLIMLFPNPIAYIPYAIKFPGLGTSSASRIIFLADFCIAVVAAFGFSKWYKKPDNRLLLKVVALFLFFSLFIFASLGILMYFPKLIPYFFQNATAANLRISVKNMIPQSIVIFLIFFGLFVVSKIKIFTKYLSQRLSLTLLIIGLSVFELLIFAWKNTPFSPKQFLFPATSTINFLTEKDKPFRIAGPGIPLNYFMVYGLNSVEGYDSLYPTDNAKWFSYVNSGDEDHIAGRYGEIYNFASPLLNYANVKYVVDYKKNISNKMVSDDGVYTNGIASMNYKLVNQEGDVSVFENLNVFPKVWITNNYEIVKNNIYAVDRILADKPSDKKIYLHEPPVVLPSIEFDNKYVITNYLENNSSVTMDVDTASDALLFLSESFSPGWKVYVDGNRSQIMRSNILFMSTSIAKGKHHIEFKYFPDSVSYGIGISAIGVIATLVIVFKKNTVKI